MNAPVPADLASATGPTHVTPTAAIPSIGGFKAFTDFAACLMPLLAALKWRGDPRHIAEALPHFAETLDLAGFRNVMANLSYQSRPLALRMDRIDARLLPCLFVPDDAGAVVVLDYTAEGVSTFDGESQEYRTIPFAKAPQGIAYIFTPVDTDEMQAVQQKLSWFGSITSRFRLLTYQIFAITLLLNLLALVTPMFVKAVYDQVVATGSLSTLAYLAIGVGIALICDLILRGLRSKILAFVGARFDNIIGVAVFQRILLLPPAMTERATIGSQVSRIKDFESVREFFTGSMALVLVELPFVFIFIATIAVMGGVVAFVPLVMVVLFGVLGAIVSPLIRESVTKSARSSSKKQEFTVEALSSMRAIRYTGSDRVWVERYRTMSAKSALHGFTTSQYSSLVNALSHVLMVSAGLATVALGVFQVLNGAMTTGGLVASMILVWRVLSPLQTGFLALTRVEQVKSSVKQLNTLMSLRAERDTNAKASTLRKIRGYVSFVRVSLRYRPDADPALMGVSFEVQPGEVVVIIGGNGSGKSTIVKLINGMYYPQGGNVRIDDMDIRQMDPIELRSTIGYVPQQAEFFYGTIAQNLRLAHPTASDEDLAWAARQAGVLDDILAMRSGDGKWARTGFEARLSDPSQLPTSFRQRLNLARAYVKRAPIMLFDEPGNGLDFAGDQAFMRAVESMRGNTTVFIVTHRPSHVRIADKVVWLENGHLRMFGPTEEVRARLPKDFL